MDINQLLCFALYSTHRSMNQLYRYYLQKFGLTYPQFMVLILLWNEDGQTINSIGKQVYLDTGTLTPLLKRLEKKNFVSRIRSKSDERIVEVWLTVEGRAFQKELDPIASSMLCDLDMTVEDMFKLSSQIHKVRESIIGSLGKKNNFETMSALYPTGK